MKNLRGSKTRSACNRAGAAGGIAPPTLSTGKSMRMALDAAGMVIWEWDMRTGSVRYSDNLLTLFSGETVEPYGTIDGVLQVLHPEDRERLAKTLDRARARGEPFECEYRVRMRNGDYRWILGKGKSVIVRGGKPVLALGVSQDITARKRTEQELQKRSTQLAKLASALTVAEHRERRRIADLIHDQMQQLLVAARLQAQTLAGGERGHKRRQIDMLHKTLDETLDLARSITSTLAPPVILHKDPVSAFAWLASAMRTRHRLSVAMRTERDLADAPEAAILFLFTAARELLLNVVKHAGSRRACVRVRRASGSLTLEVRDKGKGFEPASLSAPGEKAGFGLFSIRERAELLGGAFSVDSSPGRGTRVALSLPLPPRESAPAAPRIGAVCAAGGRTAVAGPRSRRNGRGNAIRIVIADDHPTVREGLIRLLEAQGDCAVVGEADNGEQAVAYVQRYRPDIVIMDIKMPVMDGIEATRIIAKRWPNVRVIGHSMYDGDSPLAEHLRAAGAAGYVSKSAPPKELIGTIRSCVAKKRH